MKRIIARWGLWLLLTGSLVGEPLLAHAALSGPVCKHEGKSQGKHRNYGQMRSREVHRRNTRRQALQQRHRYYAQVVHHRKVRRRQVLTERQRYYAWLAHHRKAKRRQLLAERRRYYAQVAHHRKVRRRQVLAERRRYSTWLAHHRQVRRRQVLAQQRARRPRYYQRYQLNQRRS